MICYKTKYILSCYSSQGQFYFVPDNDEVLKVHELEDDL